MEFERWNIMSENIIESGQYNISKLQIIINSMPRIQCRLLHDPLHVSWCLDAFLWSKLLKAFCFAVDGNNEINCDLAFKD